MKSNKNRVSKQHRARKGLSAHDLASKSRGMSSALNSIPFSSSRLSTSQPRSLPSQIMSDRLSTFRGNSFQRSCPTLSPTHASKGRTAMSWMTNPLAWTGVAGGMSSMMSSSGVSGVLSSPTLRSTPQRSIFSWIKSFGDNSVHVGTDPAGNKYYTYQVKGEQGLRRRVEYVPTEDGIPDTGKLHIFWESWLRGRREHPPSDFEIAQYAEKMRVYYDNVRRIDENDALLRQKEQERKRIAGTTESRDDMSTEAFILNLERKQNPPTATNIDVKDIFKLGKE